MKEFSSSLGFIVFVLCMVLGVDVAFGDKVTTWFLALILLSMLILNADKVTAFMKQYGANGLGTTVNNPDNWKPKKEPLEARGGMQA